MKRIPMTSTRPPLSVSVMTSQGGMTLGFEEAAMAKLKLLLSQISQDENTTGGLNVVQVQEGFKACRDCPSANDISFQQH